MNTSDDDNFFSRWSRRKAKVRSGEPVPEVVPPVAVVVQPAPGAVRAAPADSAPPATEEAVPPPPPTLEDTQALTPASDFSRFVARDVSAEVRNAAVKKLFADPHFNVMDGLDIYIDDYSKPSPLSAADMAKMVSAQFLKLVDDPEGQDRKEAEAAAAGAAPPAAAADTGTEARTANEDTRAPDAAEPEETHDDHADLQLQPDHVPGPQGPGPGAG
jgi:Protein of unknown function (DUF3306)